MPNLFIIIILILLLGIASGAVYFIRKKRDAPTPGDEFEILEEE